MCRAVLAFAYHLEDTTFAMQLCHIPFSLCLALTMSCLATPALRAQELKTAEYYYGRGVHDYFSGCGSCAEESLTMAISMAPDDPRPYFYRGLSRLRMGWEFEARDDLRLAAELEARSPGQYAIGKSLERVQGGHRLMIEKYRQEARLAHRTHRRTLGARQLEQLQQRDDHVERRRVPVPLEKLTGDVAADGFPQESQPQPPQPIERSPAKPTVPDAAAEVAPDDISEDPIADPFQDDPINEPAAEDADVTDDFDVDADADFGDFDADDAPLEDAPDVENPFGVFE
jgi:hypothetical protein